mgnify:CR=1 FL=1
MAEDTKKQKKKHPTAEKRLLQTEKKKLINKAFKSKVRTAVRQFDESLEAGNKEEIAKVLNEVYSLMDKGVKRGIYKVGKASRVKSRFTAKAHKVA